MREPTPLHMIYRWHSEAIAGSKPQITHEPNCGWFKRRMVKGGPWVPARIYMIQPVDLDTGELIGDEIMRCEIGDKIASAVDQWTYLAGNPITESEWRYMMAMTAWATQHAPEHPVANPREKSDFNKIPIPF